MDNRKERRKSAAVKKQPYGKTGSKQASPSSNDDMGCYFMSAALAIYANKDGDIKQRHVNALLQSDTPIIRKEDLNTLHRTVMQRLNQENDVSPDQVKDIVFLNISFLGAMPPEIFHGDSASSVDGVTPQPS